MLSNPYVLMRRAHGRVLRRSTRQFEHELSRCVVTEQAFGWSAIVNVPLDAPRQDRRADIVRQAAHLFGARGYQRTSMRDIAAAVGMLPGSVYYHFASKEALLAAVHEAAIDRALAALNACIACHTDPWDRLQAACAAHLGLLLTEGGLAAVVVDPPKPGAAQADLIRQRDRYEAAFRQLVAAVELPPGVQPGPFRLALLGALNWALTWYRPGGDPPEAVAAALFAIFRAHASSNRPPRSEEPKAPPTPSAQELSNLS